MVKKKREKMAYDGGQYLHFVGLSVQIMTTELGCMEFDWRSFRLILHTVYCFYSNSMFVTFCDLACMFGSDRNIRSGSDLPESSILYEAFWKSLSSGSSSVAGEV